MDTGEFLSRFGFAQHSHSDPRRRMQHRMTFRNERTLYKRPSSLSGKGMISIYAPDSPYIVYAPDEWWSDKWDGIDAGQEINFKRPFFEQFAELQRRVPRISLFNVNPDNSDYCQQAYNNKDCYLCTVVMDCRDSLYLSHANTIRDCLDCDYVQRCELCYDCVGGENLYECVGSDNCYNSHELLFCIDCIGCKNCIGCWGLRNQQYAIFNVPYSKEEFISFRSQIQLSRWSDFQKWSKLCRKEYEQNHSRKDYLVNTEDSTGDYLVNTKLCNDCYDSFELHECANCTWSFKSSYAQEVYGMGTSEWVYEAVGVEQLNFGACNTFVSHSGQSYYSDLCFYCTDIFGCVGLRKKKHAILNKQYDAETYRTLREKLVQNMKETGEWGKFFPIACSPFAYNESVAQERYPLTEEEAKKLGYRWKQEEGKSANIDKITLVDDSREASTDLLSQTLVCASSQKGYRLQGAELSFYQRNGIPIPRDCPDMRYQKRMSRRFK